jgi:hypothetical protein
MFYLFRLSAFALLAFESSVAATFSETGSTLKVNGLDYWAPPHLVANVPVPTEISSNQAVRNGLIPVVVITSNHTLSVAGMETAMNGFKEADDVYQPGFGEGNTFRISYMNSPLMMQ